MQDFMLRMRNRLRFSRCERLHKPITAPRTELIDVELRDNLLTITAMPDSAGRVRRIYARKTVELHDAVTFVILAQLPLQCVDEFFFPAMGTVVLFEPLAAGARRLLAAGSDINSRRCRGWIFDARED